MRKVDVLIYTPGVILPKPATIELPGDREPHYRDLNRTIGPLIGDVRFIEHVSVLFRDKPFDMFVGEFSAINPREAFNDPNLPDRPPLPVNEAATLIYHEASRKRGADLTNAPTIHGVAIITLERVWF